MNRITRFLEGKTLFITGATGFLGQPLVEKVLWSAPSIRRIYVLLRPKQHSRKKFLTAQQRLEMELFQSTTLKRLEKAHGRGFLGFLKKKLVAVAGDVTQKKLGLKPEEQALLKREVDIIINSAAVVSFDAPLDEALELNGLSAGRVARFAAACDKAILIHVSTAYVSGATNKSVPEQLHHLSSGKEVFPLRQFGDVGRDIQHIREIVRKIGEAAYTPEIERKFELRLIKEARNSRRRRVMSRQTKIEKFRKQWITNSLTKKGMDWARKRGWNDTYTYTKAIGEQMVRKETQEVPTAIVRPSVIESSLSEPGPGWLDGLRMADPLIVAIGKGRLRVLPLDPDVVIDLVPVDFVVNALLAIIPEVAEKKGLRIYHIATGSENPITLGKLYDLVYRYFKKNPMLDKWGQAIRVKHVRFLNPSRFRLQHQLKSISLYTAERTLERLSFFETTHKAKRRISTTRVAHQKLYYYGEIYEPYLNLDCRFEVENILSLLRSLSEEERKIFNFDVSQLNWRHYVQNVHIPGVKKYILKVEGSGVLNINDQSMLEKAGIKTINDLFTRTTERLPDKTALRIYRDGRWKSFSYGDLKRLVKQVARQFKERGFCKGDRVVLCSENQPEWGIVYLAASAIGLVVTPLDAQTWQREVWSVARFVEARAILASESCFKKLTCKPGEATETQLLDINALCNAEEKGGSKSGVSKGDDPAGDQERIKIGPNDPVSIIFTTSTAVDPKGAVHSHRNFLNNLLGVNHYLPIREDDQMLSILPLSHALEFTCGFLLVIFGGATVTYINSLKPRAILKVMRETGTTCMLGVPTLYALIWDDVQRRILGTSKSRLKLNLITKSKNLSKSVERKFGRNIGRQLFSRIHEEFGGKIRVFVSGGSALGEELYDDFKSIGMPVYEGYGLTETAPVLTVNPLNRSRCGSAGKPLPGVELRVFQPKKGGIGEILVRSPSQMLGYYKNPEATKKVLRAGWLHTGDLGWVDEDGHLYITGRIKDVIVTGAGKNVYPVDLEAIYQTIPGIKELCVVGIRSGLTENIHAVIVVDRKGDAVGEKEKYQKHVQRQIQELARGLPSYNRVQRIHFWPGPLPRNETKQLCRTTIRERLTRQIEKTHLTIAPVVEEKQRPTRKEELLAELSRLSGLPQEEIGAQKRIYSDLGLDSLRAIELLLFIDHQFGLSIPDEKVTDIRTVGELMREVERGSRTTGSPVPPLATPHSPFRPILTQQGQSTCLNRWLLGLSFSSLSAIYQVYFNLQLRDEGNLPKGLPYVIAANHTSHLDVGAIIAAVCYSAGLKEARRLHVLGARDYFFNTAAKGWFFSTFLNVLPIEREETSLAGLRLVQKILSGGEAILIFPEGSRSRTGVLQEFKPGLGLIAWELQVPIIPVYIKGTYQAMPVGRLVPRRREVRVFFGSPVEMAGYRSSLIPGSPNDTYRKITSDVRRVVESLGEDGSIQ